jgi:acetyl-CoA carboxylase/biotin carboxylase 1
MDFQLTFLSLDVLFVVVWEPSISSLHRANAEYIRMADVIVDVPGGSNNHNYANVTLIVELARLHGVHAVWAGWGHASENPLLPDTLAKSNPPIKFIGPAGPPMRALGDKIGSTIIAQTAGVPCIAWNGDGIFAQYDRGTGRLPEGVYEKATIGSAAEAYEAAQRIGFPIMIKASEGGGGKGIRMVSKAEDVANAYRQVCGEIPGSPIFIMKLSSNSRHLEVQLLADEYGNAVALNGRDCSVQRRHQKIIEEGPPIAAPLHIWEQMEKAAVALAKAVGYANAGTVEYLYSESEEKFYFLELNPRLQVEHPVTEMITKANLPACQLQVAMGIKLYNIPDIRRLYGKHRFEDSYRESAIIDFDTARRIPPYGHCIAVRITAENAEAGFKPTSGGIQELNFRSTPNVWGYFSMDSSGSIHEYADSQFGHLFASGNDREEARRNMVLALKELSIRGDISTTVDYISKLIEFDDFVENNIDTGWLDRLIKANVDGIGSDVGLKKSVSSAKLSSLANDVKAVIGALIVAFDSCTLDEEQFRNSLAKGQLPSQSLLLMEREVELILDGIKYKLCCRRNNANRFSVSVFGCLDKVVVANIRRLSDGGYLTDIGGKSRVAYLTSRGDAASGMRITIGGLSVSFSPDYDPSSLRTDVAGKLVKKLVEDGAHLKKGEPYCEIEVMKMFMPLKVTEAGTITWKNNEGATLSPGDLIATLDLDSPENIATTTVFEGDLDVDGWCSDLRTTSSKRPHLMLRSAFESLNNGMSGYIVSEDTLNAAFEDLKIAVTNPLLPVYEIEEPLSVLSGRLEARLYENLCEEIAQFKDSCENHMKQ